MHAQILVVDDDEDVLDLLVALLEKYKFKVLKAQDGHTALKLAETKNPQIVLLDVELPCMSGAEVCRELTKSSKFTGKIIMVSAHKKPIEQIVGLDCGASDYITKPFNEEVLVAKVRAALREETMKKEKEKEMNCTRKGDFKLCLSTRKVWLKERMVAVFTENEFKLFKKLLEKSPDYATQNELLQEMNYGNGADAKCLHVHICNPRKKLKRTKSRIETVYSKGFFLRT